MRLGQTSLIYFASRLASSAIGAIATLYIARELGSTPLGIFQLTTSLVAWLAIVGQAGVSGAISKRVSEGRETGAYTAAGGVTVGALFATVTLLVILFADRINAYVGYPAAGFIIAILFLVLTFSLIGSLLSGLHLVHVRGILSMLKTAGQSGIQIIAVFAGFGVVGLYVGHIVGYVLVILIGMYFVRDNLSQLSIPDKKHFKSLSDFAKFSWVGSLQSRMFNYTDVLVLGFFVSQSLIGIYGVAWNVGQFLILFSGTLKSTLFPEMSSISADQDPQAVSRIVEQSLTFGGLFLIPGLFGGVLLGERILRLYGPEFPQGATILSILIVANLFMGYQNQLLNTLNAIDRPDLAFRVNLVFIIANVLLNIVLIYLFSWVGAAVATAISVAISLVLAYWHVNAIIDFKLPIGEIARQWVSGAVMGGVVYGSLQVEATYQLVGYNFIVVMVLVTGGAGVYFTILLGLSREFRETVDRNVPVSFPFVSQ